jgi:hypothetical protein
VRGALLGPLIGAGADVLGGLGVDQPLQHQRERLPDDIEVAAGAQSIQQVGQGRLG